MVKLNKIYTRTGDDGTTGLVDGSRVDKYALRVACFGDVDEANSILGLVRLHTQSDPATDAALAAIQNDLFDLGADLATPHQPQAAVIALRISARHVSRLEEEIDSLNHHLAPLESFVLPGGSAGAAYSHHARTVVRRAERALCELASQTQVNAFALHYLNRLSDYLFVLARALNDNGAADVLWKPGENR